MLWNLNIKASSNRRSTGTYIVSTFQTTHHEEFSVCCIHLKKNCTLLLPHPHPLSFPLFTLSEATKELFDFKYFKVQPFHPAHTYSCRNEMYISNYLKRHLQPQKGKNMTKYNPKRGHLPIDVFSNLTAHLINYNTGTYFGPLMDK